MIRKFILKVIHLIKAIVLAAKNSLGDVNSQKEGVENSELIKPEDNISQGIEKPGSINAMQSDQPLWFSLTRKYALHAHTFKSECLPIQITIDEKCYCEITQDFVTIDDNRNAPVLAITVIKRVELKSKRFAPFIDKESQKEIVDRNDSNTLVKATLDDVLPKLEKIVEQILKLIRWRFRLSGYNNKIFGEFYAWSSDNSTWHQINNCPAPTGVVVTYLPEILLSKEQIEILIGEHLRNDENEPIAHSLLREAQSIISFSPASAFVIGVVALETAVKYFISRMVPAATWLVDNSPSPDVHRLLKDFIPTLKPEFVLSPPQLNEIKNIIFNRNKMVHSGKIDFDNNRISESLVLIEKILLKLDHHAGWTWIQKEYLDLD